MSDDVQHAEAVNAEAAAPAPPRRRVRRAVLRLLAVIVAVVAALVVTFFTIDLGPHVRELAERQGSKFLQRPMHIGRISAKLTPGVFVVEDLVIEGLTPQDRPFLKAGRITVDLPWWTIFSRKLIVESITMVDWEMAVETYEGGRHSFPRFRDGSKEPADPRPFTTTWRSVTATRGQFIYDDHGTPWTTVARNLHVQVWRGEDTYLGRAGFSDGTITIQNYEPFRTDMQSHFSIDGARLHFERIDLVSEGARSVVTGDVDLSRWPEQLYHVRSRLDFPTQKSIFFHDDKFTVSGQGDFEGTFHLFKGGRELKGTFRSDVAGVNEWRFPNLRGSVFWDAEWLAITNATAQVQGGTARFDYRMGPFGKTTPARAVWDVEYRDVDLARLTDFLDPEGLRLSGAASGRNRLEWPLIREGGWPQKRGSGDITVRAPPGMRPMIRELTAEHTAEAESFPRPDGPFESRASLGYLPVAGRIAYTFDPEWIVLGAGSWAATERTYVEFEGRTAFGARSRIPFHVTSLDWQESDRVLAAIMTAFGAPTGAVEVGGYGQFDGVMLESFDKPRIEGTFTGEALRAFDVVWGSGRAEVVIENGYAHASNGVFTSAASEIRADGQFSLGFPRRDGGEEIDARVRLTRRPIADLRHAFGLDEYRVDGLISGEYHIYGHYMTPHGYGRLLIDDGVAYGETFDTAVASLRFEGSGVQLDKIDVVKSTGRMTGAAWVAWDGSYSFEADGRRIPLESLVTVSLPRAPLSGLMELNATGAGTFEFPRYDVKLRVADLFAGDEGIGQLAGRLAVRDELMTFELEAASPRLAVSGLGRIALTPEMDAELTLRFNDTSFDPYVRFFEPRLSPFTTAIAGGTVRVVGELASVDRLVVEANVELLDLKLFDYALQNEGPIKLTLDRQVVQIAGQCQPESIPGVLQPAGAACPARLSGEGTQLQLGGEVMLNDNLIAVVASGNANLGILQGFYRDLRSRGTAVLKANVSGTLDEPVFSGSASIDDGRLRHFWLPHSLDDINGRIAFDAGGIRIEDVTATLGGGNVTFSGRLGLSGFSPGEASVRAVGERMRIRYPEGFRSTIDADLTLQGTPSAMLLSGTVRVQDSLWSRRIDASPDLFAFAGGGAPVAPAGPVAATIPLRFDVNIEADESLRLENNLAKMVASADLQLRGTYDNPRLFGRAQIDRGDIVFEGNRYLVTQGNIDFFNPTRIEPFFDIEAETRVRLPGQTYRVTIGVSGTTSRMAPPSLNSDPPLPMVDIIALLFGQTADLENAELRALQPQAAQESEAALLRQGLARALTSPLSGPVGRVFEDAIGATVQITPTLGSETDPLAPSARLVIGKRISNRAYLTFARALGSTQRDQILILEYDQNDRLGWVFTQNGDGTFAVDFRVRHRF